MYGYIVVDQPELKFREFDKYRSYYCGLCDSLAEAHGLKGQISLSYDMTFLVILLTGLYEPETIYSEERCVTHPLRKHPVRRPDRTSGRPSAGGSPSGGYSPLHCCPPPASRPHHRGCEPGGNEGLRGYGVLKPFEDAGTWRIRV